MKKERKILISRKNKLDIELNNIQNHILLGIPFSESIYSTFLHKDRLKNILQAKFIDIPISIERH